LSAVLDNRVGNLSGLDNLPPTLKIGDGEMSNQPVQPKDVIIQKIKLYPLIK